MSIVLLILFLPASCGQKSSETDLASSFPPNQPVTNIIVTAAGTVWASYGDHSFHPRGGGLLRSQDGQLTHFSTATGLPGDTIQLLALSPKNQVWAASGCRVLRLRGHRWQTLPEACSDHLPGNVLDIAFGPHGRVWIATGFELAHYGDDGWIRERILANSLAIDKQGQLIVAGWRGTQGSHFVQVRSAEGWRLLEPPAKPITRVIDDGNGVVWGWTEANDLYGLDNGSWELELSGSRWPDGLRTRHAIVAGPDRSLWLAHRLGLLVYKRGRWCLDPYLAAVDPTTLALQSDSSNSIWLGTAGGRLLSYRTVCAR